MKPYSDFSIGSGKDRRTLLQVLGSIGIVAVVSWACALHPAIVLLLGLALLALAFLALIVRHSSRNRYRRTAMQLHPAGSGMKQ